jgi:drug/metabolite transporter (DMT)-like permease
MQFIALQKKAVMLGLFFYVASIIYAFIDPTSDIEEVNKIIDKFSIPLFGEFNLWITLVSAVLGLVLYFVFYFLAYRNSLKAVPVFIVATFLVFIVLASDMGPQIDSGVLSILETFGCIFDGIIIGCLLLGRANEK